MQFPHTCPRWLCVAAVCVLLSATSVTTPGLEPKIVFYPGQYPVAVSVAIDRSSIIGTNNLSLGFMLDRSGWSTFLNDPRLRRLAQDASFRLVRVFDFYLAPCAWDHNAETLVCNWSKVDALVQAIFEIGAEPMFCLGASDPTGTLIPNGMWIDYATSLPSPEDFSKYASEWVRHFKSTGFPVRYYEIWNEPWTYFGWDPVDFVRLANYMGLFNKVAGAMRRESQDLRISFDFVMRKPVLDYWLTHGGADVDSLNFHKYDDSAPPGQETDEQTLARAEGLYFGTWPLGYSIQEARQMWFKARGKVLPLINSESNLNSIGEKGTDPRIQQMIGAVWSALVLRMEIQSGVSYDIYYTLSGNLSYEGTLPTGGAGFGMVNSDNDRPWYPYYVHYALGGNLAIGDPIIATQSNSSDVRSLAWIHKGALDVLVICRVDHARTISLRGVAGTASVLRIDNSFPWTAPEVQTETYDTAEPLLVNGYAVILMILPLENAVDMPLSHVSQRPPHHPAESTLMFVQRPPKIDYVSNCLSDHAYWETARVSLVAHRFRLQLTCFPGAHRKNPITALEDRHQDFQ